MLKKRNVVGVESGVLVQYQECFGIKRSLGFLFNRPQ